MKNKFDVCKATRRIAADTLYTVLQKVLKTNKPISEVNFRDLWLSELRKHKEIFPDGWYIPPPHGVGVIFGTEEDAERINYKSLRPEENWPQKDVFLDKKQGIAYFFAGPVDKKTRTIGDFGITIYFGKNKKVINHLKTTYLLTQKIFKYAKVGMKFSDIVNYSSKLYKENNLINTIVSSTDPTGSNIGHTIPTVDIPKNIPWKKTCKVISSNRIFLNNREETILTEGMGITIEPRPKSLINRDVPMVSFHTIGLFYDKDRKELLTNFDKIFKLIGMKYML